MDRISELRRGGELQSRLCKKNGSPTYSAIIDSLVESLPSNHTAIEILRADTRDVDGSALYLRLLGAVNRVAVADPSCPLRRFFPSLGGQIDVGNVSEVFFDVVAAHPDAVAAGLAVDIQTNEVGRAAPLSAALNYLTLTAGREVNLLEVGASAGLNLWLDRYGVDAGQTRWGPHDSPVQLTGHFIAGSPPPGPFVVTGRKGCDLNPLDLADPAALDLLRSFIWPEHVRRLNRLNAAIAAAPPIAVTAQDACSWLSANLRELPAGVITVVFHSILWPYLSAADRTGLREIMAEAGRRADHDHRLAWISLEPDESYGTIQLACRTWPGGRSEILAETNPHGEAVRWLANLPKPCCSANG
jgi:hypothetical protein